MCKQMFVCDPASGRALIGASCPDIGELGLANIYDDRDEIVRSYDPLRRFVPVEEIGQDWDSEIDDFDDEDLEYSGSTTWWRRCDSEANVESSAFTVDPVYDADCDDTDADTDIDLDKQIAEIERAERLDNIDADDDFDEEEEIELTAEQLDVMAMAELLRRRMSGPDFSRAGIQPAEKQYRGRQWARHKVGADPRPACKRRNCFALLAEVAA